MEQLKISMGIWGINNLPDRFNLQGFGDFVPVTPGPRNNTRTGPWRIWIRKSDKAQLIV